MDYHWSKPTRGFRTRTRLILARGIQVVGDEDPNGYVIRVGFQDGRQIATFNCFRKDPHVLIVRGDVTTRTPIETDTPLTWSANEICKHLPELLDAAGYDDAAAEFRARPHQLQTEDVTSLFV